jgi:hypothetical protein
VDYKLLPGVFIDDVIPKHFGHVVSAEVAARMLEVTKGYSKVKIIGTYTCNLFL